MGSQIRKTTVHKELRLPQPLALALVQYLAQRPYAEVFKIVAALQGLQEVEDPPPPTEEPGAA